MSSDPTREGDEPDTVDVIHGNPGAPDQPPTEVVDEDDPSYVEPAP